MAFEHKDMSGSFWENDKKTEAKHPDFKGQINIGGKLYDIAGWYSDKVDRLMNLKISEPRQQQGQGFQNGERQQQTQPAPVKPAATEGVKYDLRRPSPRTPTDASMRQSAASKMLDDHPSDEELLGDTELPF